MAKLTDDIGTFKTGDIITTQRQPTARVYHTTMFLEPAHSPLGVRSFVHAGSDVTEVRAATDYQNYTPPPHRHFKCPNANAGIASAAVAVSWADVNRATPYGDAPSSRTNAIASGTNANRYSGMVTTGALTDIPFEISALVRLLKWVERSNANHKLSETRGITCCAFICASFQTAFMKKFFETTYVKPQKVHEVNAALAKELETKQDVHTRAHLQPLQTTEDRPKVPKGTPIGFEQQALRDNSNRLPRQGSILSQLTTLDEQWDYIQSLLGVGSGLTAKLTKILPPLVYYDVKYLNTKLFEGALVNNQWKNKEYDYY